MIKTCECKYRWPAIKLLCVACGRDIPNAGEWHKRSNPPLSLDQIADAIVALKKQAAALNKRTLPMEVYGGIKND